VYFLKNKMIVYPCEGHPPWAPEANCIESWAASVCCVCLHPICRLKVRVVQGPYQRYVCCPTCEPQVQLREMARREERWKELKGSIESRVLF
jgi:hypothetical protein